MAFTMPTLDVPALEPDRVHIWPVRLDRFAGHEADLADWLDGVERARAERFVYARDRQSFILGRAVLRLLLGHYLGMQPAAVPLANGERGKPRLAADAPADLRFNASATAGRAIYAFALDREVGVDLERQRPATEIAGIVDQHFAPDEQADFHRLAPDEQPAAFCRAWVRKEAYLKAVGTGLHRALDAFSVTLLPTAPAALRWDVDDPAAPSRWCLQDLPVWPTYHAAVCTAGPLTPLVIATLD